MPKRTDINNILIIGAGPIIIGQACEFDYSGTQACKALKEEGYRVILHNSNPATIMTDPDLSDATYIEPITRDIVEKIILKEKPDAILPTMGGQTALNVALELEKSGFLKKHNIESIGAPGDVIERAEDRKKFRKAMEKIGIESPKSFIAHSVEEAEEGQSKIGFPVIVRPSFTLGGTGGGIAYNSEEFSRIAFEGLESSPITEILVEESLIGWKEYEMEVVRDKADNCIIVCSIENIDPMGIHTGDSITVAPALTLTDKEYQRMRDASFACIRAIGVETGGSNVQFAVNPKNGRMVIIEMNPRVSRSSALASKATGFPIAKIAAKLAVGYTLDELTNDITKTTPAAFEPTIDYVVVKIPRFTFEKFPGSSSILTTSMKSVGEVMAIGRTFAEALQKGFRSLETSLDGLDPVAVPGNGDKESFYAALSTPRPERIRMVAQALREGLDAKDIHHACKIDPWYIHEIKKIVNAEHKLIKSGLPQTVGDWRYIKSLGFSDARIGRLCDMNDKAVAKKRIELGVLPSWRQIDTCAGEFSSPTPYLYSSYEGRFSPPVCEAPPTDREKVVILGGGPNRIGQGIEFDYCCVHAAYALQNAGYETIMINCNPETVSTDYDTSDRLYFEPLTEEDVLAVILHEQKKGHLKGCIVQYGGQTPLKLSHRLEEAGIKLLGTPASAIDLAEDREHFQKLLNKLGLRQPSNAIARTVQEIRKKAEKVGYPVVVRPSYVLGGRAMEIVYDSNSLDNYIHNTLHLSDNDKLHSSILLDHYLNDAIEVDVDCIADGEDVYVAGVMEHIEEAGIHSGDSACSLPPYTLSPAIVAELKLQTISLAQELGIKGVMNVQYAIKDEQIFVLEVNPRASRTLPFVAKATGVSVAKIGACIMLGEKLAKFQLNKRAVVPHVAVKESVFPFNRFPGTDIVLGPEMRSTGEVMGIDMTFERAFAKSQLAANTHLPDSGTIFLSVKESDKTKLVSLARLLLSLGFQIMATHGSSIVLEKAGIKVQRVNKVMEGRPNCIDAMLSGEVQMVVNTAGSEQSMEDSLEIRRAALSIGIPCYTTMSGARAAIHAMADLRNGPLEVAPLQSYYGQNSHALC